ncbi:MAG: hypothetical protein WCL34_13330, partial [Methylococcaceae bacterium]
LYRPGRPASGGAHLKFKFYKTATFIVANMTPGKRSVGLELIDDATGERVFMGKVTIPPNYSIPNIGDLVEVRYLYAYKGGAVYQPNYLGVRGDSDLTDATMKQIIYKAQEKAADGKEIVGNIINKDEEIVFSPTGHIYAGEKGGAWKATRQLIANSFGAKTMELVYDTPDAYVFELIGDQKEINESIANLSKRVRDEFQLETVGTKNAIMVHIPRMLVEVTRQQIRFPLLTPLANGGAISGKYEFKLYAEPNPDHDKNSHEGTIRIKPYKEHAASLSEASHKVRKFVNDNDLGSGNFWGTKLYHGAKQIGEISYNGRVWDMKHNEMIASQGAQVRGESPNVGQKIVVFKKKVNPGVTITVRTHPGGQITDIENTHNIRFPFVVGQILNMGHRTWACSNGFMVNDSDPCGEKKIFGIRASDIPAGDPLRLMYPNKFR